MLRWSFLDRCHDFGLLLLRAGLGLLLLLLHGFPRLIEPSSWAGLGRAVSYLGIKFAYPVWGFAAVLSLTLGSVCLILGFAHRPAALALSVTLAVAAIWKYYPFGGWDAAAYPAALALVCFALLLTGPGKYTIDGG